MRYDTCILSVSHFKNKRENYLLVIICIKLWKECVKQLTIYKLLKSLE